MGNPFKSIFSLYTCQNCIIIHLGNEVTSKDYFENSPCGCVQGHSPHLSFVSQQSHSILLENQTQKTIDKQERTV